MVSHKKQYIHGGFVNCAIPCDSQLDPMLQYFDNDHAYTFMITEHQLISDQLGVVITV